MCLFLNLGISHFGFEGRISVLVVPVPHYANTPMKYTAIFHGCKNGNFQMKNCDNFLINAQNIDCGYTLECLTSTHNLCF